MSLFGNRKPQLPWDEGRMLVRWNSYYPWTIGDSFEGVQVWGDTGSGKSSTSARVLAGAMLRAGYGGLVLTVKPEDVQEWRRNLEENGRKEDGIFFGPQEGGCFNFLAYELAHGARLGVGSKNATRILTELVSMAQREATGGGDPFWRLSAEMLIAHTLDLITAAGELPSLLLARELVASAPLSLDQARDPQWQEWSKCWELIARGRARAGQAHDFHQAEGYWLQEFPRMPEKTRQSVVATFTASVAHHFCSEAMHRMFGGGTSVSPDDIFAGKVVVVSLPVLTYGQAGRFASVVWKYCTQLALERRTDRQRPVFLFSDEAHYFLTDHDQLFQTTARSARCATVYLSQNRSNYLAESPGDAGRHRMQSLVACLKTQIMHQCSDEETRRAFADSIGKHRITRLSNTHQFGQGRTTHSESEQWVDEYWVLPDTATNLKTGGKANGFQVTAIVSKAGKRFGNGKPALRVQFDQRNFEERFWGSQTIVALRKPEPKR
jgi:hypothetical protein